MAEAKFLTGKVMIVTGGAGGIGRATAYAASTAGAAVVVADVLDSGQATAARIREAGGQAEFVACDVSEPEQVSELIRRTVIASDDLTSSSTMPGLAAVDCVSTNWRSSLGIAPLPSTCADRFFALSSPSPACLPLAGAR
jgi:NAD(P)-dependent dehydrogenase (short-subunit alcohol dehydrogenase family)